MLNSEDVKEFARTSGADLVGIANIERFKDIPAQHNPVSIFPEAKSVIVIGRRITRGTLRGVEEGTQFGIYNLYGCDWLENRFLAMTTFKVAEFLEDNRWEAVPLPNLPHQIPPMGIAVKPDQPEPNVMIGFDDAAVRAGLGEIGYCNIFLTPEFGPRQRLAAIITDMPLEPDTLVEPESICKRCMQCVKECPSGAIPHIKEKKTVEIKIEDKTYQWADVHMGKCVLGYHGGDSSVSPFIHKSFPGWDIDAGKQDFSEAGAYKFCWTLSTTKRNKTTEDPSGYIIEGHAMLQKWGVGGSYGVGGSRGCMRSCFNYLEKKNLIEQTFTLGEFIKRPRWLLPAKVKKGEQKDAIEAKMTK